MSDNLLTALISILGTLLGAGIGGYFTLKGGEIAFKKMNEQNMQTGQLLTENILDSEIKLNKEILKKHSEYLGNRDFVVNEDFASLIDYERYKDRLLELNSLEFKKRNNDYDVFKIWNKAVDNSNNFKSLSEEEWNKLKKYIEELEDHK